MKTLITAEQLKDFESVVRQADYYTADTNTKYNLLRESKLLPIISQLHRLHIVSIPTPDKEMFINWHSNKYYPDATIDNLLDRLEDEVSEDVIVVEDEQLSKIEEKLDKILEILTCVY